jgi:hexosaminidase
MKVIGFLTLILFLGCSVGKHEPTPIKVIPLPNEIVYGKGVFKIKKELTLHFNNEKIENTARIFAEQMEEVLPVQLTKSDKANINLILQQPFNGSELYELKTTKQQITINANSVKGIFYGLQTLRQLLLFADYENGRFEIPVITIRDQPRFGWRGIMLDESRHFFGAQKVKELLDLMALHKLNIFHWHLTDVPGWRIEIKKYPKLSEVGGIGNHSNPDAPAAFYTQEEIKEIVHYAAERNIEIIPEIDMPGHATAANRAYPEFSGGGSERYPEFTFNPGKNETYSFLTGILKEVAALFPTKYIHLGGDEVHFGNESWNTNPDVQRLMKQHDFNDLKEVESYFVHRMADSIQMLGKTVIGWDEIVDHGLSPENSLVMWWRHNLPEKLGAALNQNFSVVLCPRIPLYFDFVQHESHKTGRRWAGAFSPPDLVYQFPPDTFPGFSTHFEQIKGIQANLWTEQISTNKRLDFMIHPRLSALAEAAWTVPEEKNYSNFKDRVKQMMKFFESKGIYYFNLFEPKTTPEPNESF